MENLYTVLGVPHNATSADIKAARRQLTRENHPDRGGSQEQMAKINQAFATLSDPEKRKHYDETGEVKQPMTPEEKAKKMFLELTRQCLTEPGNIVENMKRFVNDALKEANDLINSADKNLDLMRARVNRVRGPEPNLIVETLHSEIKKRERAVKKAMAEIEIIKIVQTTIDDYESDEMSTPKMREDDDFEEMLAKALFSGSRPRRFA